MKTRQISVVAAAVAVSLSSGAAFAAKTQCVNPVTYKGQRYCEVLYNQHENVAAKAAKHAAKKPAKAAKHAAQRLKAWNTLTAPPPESATPLATLSDARRALHAAYRSGNLSHMPAIAGADGSVKYPFGYSRPVVVTAPGQVSTFEMQPGFKPSGYSVSQPASWIIKQGMAGNQPVLFIQPRFRYLHANLVVYGAYKGKPRIYQARLVSDRTSYTPLVGFYYPQQIVNGWTAKAQAVASTNAKAKAETVATMPSLNVNAMHFNYSVTCEGTATHKQAHGFGGYKRHSVFWFDNIGKQQKPVCSMKPTRVFNDGTHTYIQMPNGVNHGSLPVIMGKNSAGQNAVLNYQYHPTHRLYVIDSIPHKLVMIEGVGKRQARVVIKEQ